MHTHRDARTIWTGPDGVGSLVPDHAASRELGRQIVDLPPDRALAFQSRFMIGAVLAVVTLVMWLVSNG